MNHSKVKTKFPVYVLVADNLLVKMVLSEIFLKFVFDKIFSKLAVTSELYLLKFSGHNYIGSEHLLLGLLREGEGVAARVLENLGADPTNIRTQASLIPLFHSFLLLLKLTLFLLSSLSSC